MLLFLPKHDHEGNHIPSSWIAGVLAQRAGLQDLLCSLWTCLTETAGVLIQRAGLQDLF